MILRYKLSKFTRKLKSSNGLRSFIVLVLFKTKIKFLNILVLTIQFIDYNKNNNNYPTSMFKYVNLVRCFNSFRGRRFWILLLLF